MKTIPPAAVIFCLLITGIAPAEQLFEVTALEGTAKVQRSEKLKWEKLSVGDQLGDNDIIETFFQSRLVITFSSATAIFGSNSKAVLSIVRAGADKKKAEPIFSLFNGGVCVQVSAKGHASVFTTNTVAETDSGSVAVIVDPKAAETGVLVLGGKAIARNISEQKSKELAVGMTTIVLPGREPAPPLSISFRHVTVLKHFFGDRYIADQLRASSIIPSEDRSAGSRMTLSQGVEPTARKTDVLFYKRLFNINRIYESILDDRDMSYAPYAPIFRDGASSSDLGHLKLAARAGGAAADGAVLQEYTLMPAYRCPLGEVALRFPAARNDRRAWITGFSSTAGILDKIDHVTAGSVNDSLYLTVGTFDNVTLGNGLIVDRFRNGDDNRIFHPVGLAGKAKIAGSLTAGGFLDNIVDPAIGGIHLGLESSIYSFGAGLYFDADQFSRRADTDDIRFLRSMAGKPPAQTFPDTTRVTAGVAVYEIGLGVTIAENYASSARLLCEFAQKRTNGTNDGFLLRAPALFVSWPRFSARGGCIFETGRIVSREFNEFYCSHRSYYKCDSRARPAPVDTLLTENTSLWNRRENAAVFAGFGVNPTRGLDFSIDFTQNFRTRNTFVVWNPDSTTDTSANTPQDFSLEFRLAMNRFLCRCIDYGCLSFRQIHGRLFPRSGSYFSSWNCEARLDIVTVPLYQGCGLECGGRMLYLDRNQLPDDIADSNDRIFEFYGTLFWNIF